MAKRQFAGGIVLCLVLAAPLAAEPPATAVIGTPPQPFWSQLAPRQKEILAPLSLDWDKMENIRRKKWLGIAERYPNMTATEQRRMQDRMREWATLSSAQRNKARDAYKDFKQLPAEQKQVLKQKWEAYSNLPVDEQRRIRSSGKSSKLLSPSSGQETAVPEILPTPPENTGTPATMPPSPQPPEANTGKASKR